MTMTQCVKNVRHPSAGGGGGGGGGGEQEKEDGDAKVLLFV